MRSNRLLVKKFIQYLFPTMITVAALSLNEFVDSMLVSRLLGSSAMAIVNQGAPMMLIMASLFTLLGSGGATVYAMSLGARDRKRAGSTFTCSMITALISGIILMALCLVFFEQFSSLLCESKALREEFCSYFKVLIYSAPLLVTILTFAQFLPPAGLPGYATAVNVVANVVNIIMDYVYIHYFGMDVSGAAYATLTGYVCSLALIIFLLAEKKLKLYVSGKIFSSFSLLPEILRQGSSDVMSQIGFALQIMVCNRLATGYAGTDGVVSYALLMQALSVTSVFIGSLIGAFSPLIALLQGQHDFRGKNSLLKLVMRLQFILALMCSVVFIVFAEEIAGLYNIRSESQIAMASSALRIFSICLLIRSATVIYFRYLKIIGMTGYAALVGAMDGFLTLIPVVIIMTRLVGADGIWYGYALNAMLVLSFVIIRNLIIMKRSGGRFKGVLLYESETESVLLLDVTISKNREDISGIGQALQKICVDHGMDERTAMHSGLAVEEMAVYASNNKKQDSYMDVLVRKCDDGIAVDFRSLGADYESMDKLSEEAADSIHLLEGIADSISHDYAMGMNSTHIVLKA